MMASLEFTFQSFWHLAGERNLTQYLFAPEFVWAWWIIAFYWALTAIRTAAGWHDD